MLYIAKDKVYHMSMSENERQALNIKNKVQEFDDGVISAEDLVAYVLDREFIHDDFANNDQRLSEGRAPTYEDRVVVEDGVDGEGLKGYVIDLSPSGKFATIEFKNGDTAYYHLSDLRVIDYADEINGDDEEYDDEEYDEEYEEWNDDGNQARNESVKLTFDKFLAAESVRDNRIVGVSEDSAIRERARRHQERPINRIRWG